MQEQKRIVGVRVLIHDSLLHPLLTMNPYCNLARVLQGTVNILCILSFVLAIRRALA